MTTAGTRPFGLASDGYPDMRLPPLIGSEPPPVTESEYREFCAREGVEWIPPEKKRLTRG